MVDLTGAGPAESAAATLDAVKDFDDATDVADVVLNAGALTVDGLGFLANPVDTFATSAIGWLVEHLEPLRWPLDVTLGDPRVVRSAIGQWNEAALTLDGVAHDYAKAPTAKAPTYLHGNSRSAAALAAATPVRREQISGASMACAQVAHQTAQAAALVAATRGLIRDTIIALLWDLLKKAVTRLAFAPLTFGSTALALVWDTVVRVAAGLRKIATVLADLLDRLKVLVANMRELTAGLDRYFSVTRPVSSLGGRLLPNPTALPKVALDVAREEVKVDDTGLATAEDRNADAGHADEHADAVRDKHAGLAGHERTTGERNADLPPPAAHETGDWWTRRGTLY